MFDKDHVRVIVQAAAAQRLAEIDYLKPAEEEPTRRVVEAYEFQHNGPNVMILCWQVDPSTSGEDAWRCFRTDRIVHATDAGGRFEPRIPITLGAGVSRQWVYDQRPKAHRLPVEIYQEYLVHVMLDGRVTAREMAEARRIAANLDSEQVLAAHARVYADVLREVALDGRVEEHEAAYLGSVARFLGKLGWAPPGGDA